MNSYALQQGKLYKSRKEDYKKYPSYFKSKNSKNMKIKGNVENKMIENFETINQEENEFNLLQTEVQKLLQEYSTKYNVYLENIKVFHEKIKPYINKNVKDANGVVYYITSKGVARRYQDWNNKHPSCDKTPIAIQGAFHSIGFVQGSPIQKGEPCGYENSIIINDTTRERAYITPYGVRRLISTNFKDTTQTCSNLKITELADNVYNSFQQGEELLDGSTCGSIDLEPKLANELVKINMELMKKAEKMYNVIIELKNTRTQDEDKLDEVKTDLERKLKIYKNMFDEVKPYIEEHNQKSGRIETMYKNIVGDIELRYNSRKLQYWTWFFITIILVVILMTHMMKK